MVNIYIKSHKTPHQPPLADPYSILFKVTAKYRVIKFIHIQVNL